MTELTLHAPEMSYGIREAGPANDLMVWAESARAAASIAVSLVKTSFVPEAFRGKPEEATAAILSGAEVGLSPMASLRSFDIIQGTAAPRAITLRAVVQSAGHEIWTEETTATRAIVCGQRRGSAKPERSVWTLDRAKNLGLTGKKNWQTQPQAMLLARATSECARLVAADAILGIPYSVEELEDEQPTPTVTAVRADKPRTTRRALAPAPEEPSLDETPVDPDLITDAQMKKLHASMNERGFTDRDLALAFLSETMGREVASSKELTKVEASLVIDVLERLGQGEPTEPAVVDPDEPAWPETAQPGGGE